MTAILFQAWKSMLQESGPISFRCSGNPRTGVGGGLTAMSSPYFCSHEANPDHESRNFLLSTFVQWFARRDAESSVIETMYNLMNINTCILINLFIWKIDADNIGFEARVEAQGRIVHKASICLLQVDPMEENAHQINSVSSTEWFTNFDEAIDRAFTRTSDTLCVDVDLSCH